MFFHISHNFQTWFHNADHLLYYPQMSLFSFDFFSLISVSKKWNIETMLIFPYSYNWQKLTTTKWMKKEARSKSYSGASFETILLFHFCTVSKILICFNLIEHFPNNWKRYSSHLQASMHHYVAPIKVFLPYINVFH